MPGTKTKPCWRNRIVDSGEEAPDQLLANPNNWRIHPKFQQDALAAILDEVGWVQDVIVNRTTGHLVDGHLRVQLALRRGELTIPVKYVELTTEEELKIITTLDPLGAMASKDRKKFQELLDEIEGETEQTQQALRQISASEGMIEPIDTNQEWQGMPEFQPPIGRAFKSITVHFASEKDVHEFAGLIGQSIGERTRFIWYPRQAERRDWKSQEIISES